MKIKLEFIKSIPYQTKRHIRVMVDMVKGHIKLNHPLTVRVVPAQVIGTQEVGFGFGLFEYDKKGKDLTIMLSGHQLPDLQYDEWIEMIMEALCHELAHYEQFRDGKKVQERGVRVRARNLMKKAGWSIKEGT